MHYLQHAKHIFYTPGQSAILVFKGFNVHSVCVTCVDCRIMLSLLFSSCWVGKGCEGTLRVWSRVLTPGILDYCIHCGQWLWFHAGEPGLECWCTLVCWSREWVVGWQKLASLGMHVLHCVFMCIIKNKLRTKDTCIHRLKKTIVTSQDDAVTSFPCLLGEFSPRVIF